MNFKEQWWKFLAVFIMLYVIIAGLMVPLKSGIVRVDPISVKSGQLVSIEVHAYNGNYDKAKELNAWLKFDSIHYISSSKISIVDHNKMFAEFILPAALPGEDSIVVASLIVDNEIDGYSLLPNALFVKEESAQGLADWELRGLSGIHLDDKFRFPFRNILYETIRNTFFHVALWMAMFFLMTMALIYSIKYLLEPSSLLDHKASSYTSVSLLYGLLGLATGSVWAKFTWGAFWTSDVKLNMAAVAVLIYLAYTILRGSISDRDKQARVAAAYNIFAYFAMIPLLLIIPRLTDSLHPGNGGNPAFGGEDLDNTLRMVFYPAILALILFGIWMSNIRIRVLNLNDKLYK